MASKSPLEINFLPSSISPPPAGEDGGEAKNFSYASSSKEKRKERKREREDARARVVRLSWRGEMFFRREGEDRMHSRPETSRRRSLGCLRGCRSISFGASRLCSVERAVVGRGGGLSGR